MFRIILKKKILSQAPKSDWYISDTRWWIPLLKPGLWTRRKFTAATIKLPLLLVEDANWSKWLNKFNNFFKKFFVSESFSAIWCLYC